jgi:hypothetical protein
MQISKLIAQLEKYKQEYGDVDVKSEQTDGRSTWFASASIKVEHTKRWPLDRKEFIISI